jgi:hypothetical protein
VREVRSGLCVSAALVPTRSDGRCLDGKGRWLRPDFLAHQAAIQSAREGGQPPHVAPLLAPPMT